MHGNFSSLLLVSIVCTLVDYLYACFYVIEIALKSRLLTYSLVTSIACIVITLLIPCPSIFILQGLAGGNHIVHRIVSLGQGRLAHILALKSGLTWHSITALDVLIDCPLLV